MFQLVILAAIGLGVWLWWRHKNSMFSITIRNGRVESCSQGAPASFVHGVRDIVAFPPVQSAKITASRGENGAQLRFSGDIDEGRAQRIRNVFRLTPAAQFTSGQTPFTWSNLFKVSFVASILSAILPRRRW